MLSSVPLQASLGYLGTVYIHMTDMVDCADTRISVHMYATDVQVWTVGEA